MNIVFKIYVRKIRHCFDGRVGRLGAVFKLRNLLSWIISMGLYIDFFEFLLLPILGQNYLDRVSGRLEQEVYELPQSSKLCPIFFAFVYGLKQLGFCLSNKRCHCCLMDHVGCDCYSNLHTLQIMKWVRWGQHLFPWKQAPIMKEAPFLLSSLSVIEFASRKTIVHFWGATMSPITRGSVT